MTSFEHIRKFPTAKIRRTILLIQSNIKTKRHFFQERLTIASSKGRLEKTPTKSTGLKINTNLTRMGNICRDKL